MATTNAVNISVNVDLSELADKLRQAADRLDPESVGSDKRRTVTISWPLDASLVSRCIDAGHARLMNDFGPQVSGRLNDMHYESVVCGVLDTIGEMS